MSGTTVAAARAALYDLLVDTFADEADVQVLFGPPEVYELDKVVGITSQEPVGQREDWASLGNSSREEEYSIDVVVKVYSRGAGNDPDGAKAVDAEAFRLVEAIRNAVHASKGLGLNDQVTGDPSRNARAAVTGAPSAGPQPPVDRNGNVGAGWICFVDVVVTVQARISA